MRTILILLFSLSFVIIHGQVPGIVEIKYGQHFAIKNFYNSLTTIENPDFSKPITLGGVSYTRWGFTGNYSNINLNFIIPSDVSIDSTKFNLTGGIFSLGIGFDILRKINRNKSAQTKFFLLTNVGFSTGQIRLTNKGAGQQNLFFSPKVGLTPRLIYKKLSSSLLIEFNYDISNQDWKEYKWLSKETTKISGYKQTGLTLLFGLGYFIN